MQAGFPCRVAFPTTQRPHSWHPSAQPGHSGALTLPLRRLPRKPSPGTPSAEGKCWEKRLFQLEMLTRGTVPLPADPGFSFRGFRSGLPVVPTAMRKVNTPPDGEAHAAESSEFPPESLLGLNTFRGNLLSSALEK